MPCYSLEGVVPVVDPSAYVHPSAVLIGDVVVGPGCYVGPCASLRGDFCRIELHAGSNVQDSCVLHGFPGINVVVEENGHVGHASVLHSCIVRRDALKNFRQLRGVERTKQVRQPFLLHLGQRSGGLVCGQLPKQCAGLVHIEALQAIRQIGGVQGQILFQKNRRRLIHSVKAC